MASARVRCAVRPGLARTSVQPGTRCDDMYTQIPPQGEEMHAVNERLPFLSLRLEAQASARRSINAAPLPELRGADAPPLVQPGRGGEWLEWLECEEVADEAYSTDLRSACIRVLCWNPPRVDRGGGRARVEMQRRKFSFLGVTGHIERMNAFTHLFGTLLFLVFASVRPATALDSASTAGKISTATSYLVALTFLVSTCFHTLGTVRWLAPIMRTFDHGAIDVALAAASTADLAVVTLGFADVPWQTVADAVCVAVVILAFFVYRRAVLPASATELEWGDCALGLFRRQHADFEHSALRSASYVTLSFGFLTVIPAAFANLTHFAAVSLVVANGTALLLLIAGLLLDNVLVWPDVIYNDARKRRGQKPWLFCHSTQCGCIVTSHAIWHVFTLVSVVLQTVGREIAIAETLNAE